jgi:glutamyl-tRNA synthetase
MEKLITRFAPSPTGNPHVGNIRTALFGYLAAKASGGKFFLRIEDTDRARFVPGSVEYIHEALKWLGLDYDGEVTYQSERLPIYQKKADELVSSGHAYKCFCTPERLEKLRADQIAKKQPPAYDGLCQKLTPAEIAEKEKAGLPSVIRLAMPKKGTAKWNDLVRDTVEIAYKEMDDFVIIKSDGWPTYHLANVIDDHEMGINCVVRGEEWIPSTPKHIYLYKIFGWDYPQFAHLPVILGGDKQKLSKRNGDSAILDYKKKGYLPEAMINFLVLLGWSSKSEDEIFTLEELEKRFRIDDVNKAPAVFDIERLNWLNGQYIRKTPNDKLQITINELFPDAKITKADNFGRILEVEKSRLVTLEDITQSTDFYLELPKYDKTMLVFKKSTPEATKVGIEKSIEALSGITSEKWLAMSVEEFTALLQTIASENNLTNGDVFWPIRFALSGQERSASPSELLWVFGKEESLSRMKKALA